MYNPKMIKDTLSELRNAKTSVFLNKNGLTNFKNIVETCRIIDTAMLPMFYIWEHYFHRKLIEIKVEKHLEKPYERFSKNPITNTWEFYLFLKIGISCSIPKDVRNNLLYIYEPLINNNSFIC